MTPIGRTVHRDEPVTVTVTLLGYAAALLAWLGLLVHDSVEHLLGSHAVPLGHTGPGVAESLALADGVAGVGHYLGMWGLMVVAMMYPAAAGAFQWYADRRRGAARDHDAVAVATFVGSYTLLWVVVGLVPLAVVALVPLSSLAAAWGPLYLGVALLGVAAFQLSSFKRLALRRCRTPAALFAPESAPPGPARLGWTYGRRDLASCGVLMGLMVVVGSMQFGWMALITGVLTLEQATARGELWARLAGLASLVAGSGLVVLWLW